MKNIFLIDDDIDDRSLFREALEFLQIEFDLQEAENGEQALKMVDQKDFNIPDIIFLDLNMPKIGGYEVLLKLKELSKYKSIPIYIYSTSSNKVEKDKCIQAGATDFITKHYSFQNLCNALNLICMNVS